MSIGRDALRERYDPLVRDEAYWNREFSDRRINHDLLPEEESPVFTIIPDLASLDPSELERAGGPHASEKLSWLREDLRSEGTPRYLSGDDVDLVLMSMYTFPSMDSLADAEDLAVDATERTPHTYVPAVVDGEEPRAIQYEGPREYVVSGGGTDRAGIP